MPWITSTSPSFARLCASISPSRETFVATASATGIASRRFNAVRACPAMRAFGSVGRSTAAGMPQVMPSSSQASETRPDRSPSAR